MYAVGRRVKRAARGGLQSANRARRPVEAAFPSSQPVSRRFGYDRGRPIDRYYIESFLASHRPDIRGRVLEVADDRYSRRFGGRGIERSILHVDADAPGATLVGDLVTGEGIPADAFDCAIVTQTLPFVYDIHGAVANLHRLLAPGGVTLVTLSGISQISRYDMERWGDFWRFTSLSALRLFEEAFHPNDIDVTVYGNVFAASALLYGLAVEDTGTDALDPVDDDYQVTLGVRAVRR
jgi:methyltransferase family protein